MSKAKSPKEAVTPVKAPRVYRVEVRPPCRKPKKYLYLYYLNSSDMTTVLNVSLNDLNSQFINDLKQKFDKATEVEIRLQDKSPADDFFSEDDFWRIIDQIDWSKKGSESKVAPAVKALAQMPVAGICLFADKVSEKLYQLDTRAHATIYAANEPDNFISADDFLYARCAVIAEGKEYYEKVLNDPTKMPEDIVFEPLLYIADDAFEMKMNVPFNYMPTYNYETQSNKSGWQLTQ